MLKDHLEQINSCIHRFLHQCSVAANDINAVYMTGGTSFVPTIRKLFEGIFGAVPIRAGEEFTSVAEGLALFALELA